MARARAAPSHEQLTINDRKVTVSNLDKLFFSDARFTKAQVINYYIRVSEYLLPFFWGASVWTIIFGIVPVAWVYQRHRRRSGR
jgi:DNA primase